MPYTTAPIHFIIATPYTPVTTNHGLDSNSYTHAKLGHHYCNSYAKPTYAEHNIVLQGPHNKRLRYCETRHDSRTHLTPSSIHPYFLSLIYHITCCILLLVFLSIPQCCALTYVLGFISVSTSTTYNPGGNVKRF